MEDLKYLYKCPNCGSINMGRLKLEFVKCFDCAAVTDMYEAMKKAHHIEPGQFGPVCKYHGLSCPYSGNIK